MNKHLLLAASLFSAACSSNTKQEVPAAASPAVAPAPPVAPAVTDAPAATAIDEKNGFRAHHFGDDVSTFSNLEPAYGSKGDNKTYYTKAGKENLKIGDAALSSIAYSFYKNKFYQVRATIQGGYTGLDKVIAALEVLYGKPTNTGTLGKWSSWKGQKAEATATMAREDALLTISSKTIVAEIAEADKLANAKAAQKGSADL